MKNKNLLTELPKDLPEPIDDGFADHLPGISLPIILVVI